MWSKKYLRIYHSRGLVDDDVVIEHYEAWKKQLIYVVYSETNVLTGKTVKKFILSPKRGTPKYSRRVMGKFRKAFNFGRHLKYFEHNTSDKFVYGSMLHVVLEFDSNRFEKADCWNGIGVALNLYMSMLKRRFGSKVACIRTYESMISGYPHIHCILYFPNYIFKGTKMNGKFRVCGNDWRELKKCWKSGFSNIRMVDGFHGALRYLYKYVAKSCSYKEAMKVSKPDVKRKLLLGLALCWLYSKRSFSISNEKLFHSSVLPVNNDEIFICNNSNDKINEVGKKAVISDSQFNYVLPESNISIYERKFLGFMKRDRRIYGTGDMGTLVDSRLSVVDTRFIRRKKIVCYSDGTSDYSVLSKRTVLFFEYDDSKFPDTGSQKISNYL